MNYVVERSGGQLFPVPPKLGVVADLQWTFLASGADQIHFSTVSGK